MGNKGQELLFSKADRECNCHFNKKCKLLSYSKIGEEQSAEDAEDGPPELLVPFCSGFSVLTCCVAVRCLVTVLLKLQLFINLFTSLAPVHCSNLL